MTRLFLGVDVGGSKTHALIADETGQAVGFGEGGPGNPESVGYAGLTAAAGAAVQRALDSAGLTREQIAGAGFGIAGYDWPSQRAVTLRALEPLGLNAPLEIVNDTLIGLLAGAAAGWGVAVVAGTGCNCRGWDQERREGRVTGFGVWYGEAAGAGDLVNRATRAVALEWARRGPPTRLSAELSALVGAPGPADLLEGLTTGRLHLQAEAAPVVFRVAGQGDAVARALIEASGRELGDMALGVIRQLNFERLAFEVVLVGSLYNGGALLTEPMRAVVQAAAPGARFVRLTAPPVIGGVLLGMEQAGVPAPPRRENLIQSAGRLPRPAPID